MSDDRNASETPGRDGCPSAATLAAWDSGKLIAAETERIAEHLERCPRCLAANATAPADEELISWTLMQSPATALDEPALAHALTALLSAPEQLDPTLLPAEAIGGGWSIGTDGVSFPERIGSYALVRPLGRGAMGWVFEAEHVNLRRRVAIKLLSPSARLDAAQVARFYAEMAAVGKLAHANIVQAFDAGEADGHHYLAMELVGGCDASKLIKRLGPLNVADACELARQIAAALHYAHAHGMAHRDVKPSNVIITPQGQVKLLDLGLATIRNAGGVDSSIAGTAEYMAPERWASHDASGAAGDQYALGCTLFKLLTGTTPYAPVAATANELAEAHRDAAIPSLRTLRSDVPVELDDLVARLLAKRPVDRPGTTETIATLARFTAGADLRSLIARAILIDSDADTLPPSRTWTSVAPAIVIPQRRLKWLAASAVGLLILAGAAAWTYRLFNRGEVAIEVHPPGASISIDGGAPLIADLDGETLLALASGKHTLVVTKEGFGDATEEITVERGARLDIRIPLATVPLLVEETDQWLAHDDGVRQLTVSPDGLFALTSGKLGVIRLWNLKTHEMLREFLGHDGPVHSLAFSPDGRHILSGGNDFTVRLWDVGTGSQLKKFLGHTRPVLCGVFSHDGKRIATGSEDATLRVWDLATSECLWLGAGHYVWVRSVDFSADDQSILSGGNDTLSIVWDAHTGRMRRALIGQSSVVLSGQFSADATRALTGGYDRQALLWDVEHEERLRAYVGHAEGVIARFTRDERNFVTASIDRELRYWSVDHRHCLARFLGHSSGVTGVTCLPDGKEIISSSWDGTLRIWKLPEASVLPDVPAEPMMTQIPAPEPAENVARVAPLRIWRASERPIHAAAISHDGTMLLTAGEDQIARLWNLQTGEILQLFRGAEDHLLCVAFSADDRFIATSGKDAVVRVYDTRSGAMTLAYRGHRNWVTSLSFMTAGPWLLSSSIDGTLRTWRYEQDEVLQVLAPSPAWIRAAAFSPNPGSSYAISAGHDAQLTLWEIGSGTANGHLNPDHSHILASVAYSPDGRRVAAAGWSSSWDVWDLVEGRHLASSAGHLGAIYGIAFPRDNDHVVTAGEDYSVRLWDIVAAQETARFTGPTASMRAVTTSRAGLIAAAGLDGRVFVWESPKAAPNGNAPRTPLQ